MAQASLNTKTGPSSKERPVTSADSATWPDDGRDRRVRKDLAASAAWFLGHVHRRANQAPSVRNVQDCIDLCVYRYACPGSRVVRAARLDRLRAWPRIPAHALGEGVPRLLPGGVRAVLEVSAARAVPGQAAQAASGAAVVSAADDPVVLVQQDGPDLAPGAVPPQGDRPGDAECPGTPRRSGPPLLDHAVTVTLCASTPFRPCWVSNCTRWPSSRAR